MAGIVAWTGHGILPVAEAASVLCCICSMNPVWVVRGTVLGLEETQSGSTAREGAGKGHRGDTKSVRFTQG